jgi:AcrR family transcriptional regulator
LPRRPDPDLEREILDAAQKLWKKGGEKALTMRAVAKAAGTNTPSVYRRFRDRDDILRGLLQRVRLEIAASLDDAATAREGCERYLEYALGHPHEYELFYQHNYDLYHSPRSSRAGVKPAAEVGGTYDEREALLTALWMVVHGAAMLLIAKTILPQDAGEARVTFAKTVAALLQTSQGT